MKNWLLIITTLLLQSPNNIPPADPKPQTLYTPSKEEDCVFMVAHFNNNNISPTLHFPILSSYGNPCLDLFFHVLAPNVEAEDDSDKPPASSSYKYLKQLLPLAWSHNPLTTLKLICNLRDCSNDLGKSDEEAFYAAAFWLHQNHPETLACNVASIAGEFSQSVALMHDLVEILYRLLQGQDVRRRREKEKAAGGGNHNNNSISSRRRRREQVIDIAMAKKKDIHEISSTSYFCPSIDSSTERATFLCESVARKIFPRDSSPEYRVVSEARYAYRVRDRLRQEVLVPLINALDYFDDSGTKACAVKKYLEDVKGGHGGGKCNIAAGALLPNDIVGYADDVDVGQVAELQWKAMVMGFKKQGKLNNCLAVCDVSSSSMAGIQNYMDVSVGLGLLLSQLSEKPCWKGKVISFSPNPELHLVGGDDLKSRCEFVRRMDCGGSKIDLHKVFDLILEAAVKGNLKTEQMVKKVFVFTNTCFEVANSGNDNKKSCWESDYKAIQSKFKEKGYEKNAVPEIVYWKLDMLAVPRRRPGLAIFGGFSADLLKLFVDNDGQVSPYHVMEAAISPKHYQNLAVVD
ncbi:uncharacterized protein LOC18778114 [Prunus persica]|uniref:uncharacterized protein LOC18778114 n=1 Tax=Prunus persica TaxID=3760 RepID=UPI0009AB9A5A|nr:uncharacterized protein LOC18778114 [Prunus persica]